MKKHLFIVFLLLATCLPAAVAEEGPAAWGSSDQVVASLQPVKAASMDGKRAVLAVKNNANTFHGRVNSDGTPVRLPEGWTSTKGIEGAYIITHNLSTNKYSAVVIPRLSASEGHAHLYAVGANTLEYRVRNHDGILIDSEAHFILLLD